MTMPHTPGPWEARIFHGFDGFGIFAKDREHSLANSNLYEHTAYVGTFGEEETGANARLIAAAPDMLAALNAIFDGFADGSIHFTKKRQSESDPHHPANTLMCAAIAKAEGRE
jgi:hypothetical protein